MQRRRALKEENSKIHAEGEFEEDPREDNDVDQVKELVGDESQQAQVVVRELYTRYEKQVQRWKDYKSLFLFLFFTGWYLAVLYLQRQADVAFQVYATIDSVLTPDFDQTQDPDDVYQWLETTLANIWVDPVCGDGTCNLPWEYPSYSTFGCRADCGRMQDTMNITEIQLDLYWNFTHPTGSIPSILLLGQSTWNLCPTAAFYNGTCYFTDSFGVASNQKFSLESGSYSSVLSDVPDGAWDVVVKQDTFNKVSGAVRHTAALNLVSYYYKVYVAAVTAMAQQNMELSLLRQAVTYGSSPLFLYIKLMLEASNSNITETNFQYSQLITATCACDIVPVNSSLLSSTWGAQVYSALNNTLDYFDTTKLNNITSVPQYKSTYCANLVSGTPVLRDAVRVNVTSDNTLVFGNISDPAVNYTTVTIFQPSTDPITTCGTQLGALKAWQTNMTASLQKLFLGDRLGDGVSTGIASALTDLTLALGDHVLLTWPELYKPVFVNPAGTVPLTNPEEVALQYLQELYVTGITYSTQPAPAATNISERNVRVNLVSLPYLAQLAQARILELTFQQNELNTSIQVPPPGEGYPANMSVGELVDLFVAAGATNVSVPDASDPAMGELRTDYNLVSWEGNSTAFMTCDLKSRGPEFVGTCVPMNVSCVPTTNDTIPFNCTAYNGGGGLVPGDLSLASYRLDCEIPCTMLQDCNQLCECYNSCSNSEVCSCSSCLNLGSDAYVDPRFTSILRALTSADTGIRDVSATAGKRRHLQQTSGLSDSEISTQLSTLLGQVTGLKSQSSTITSSMATLAASIQQANVDAAAVLKKASLEALVKAGRADIDMGQKGVIEKLNIIIGQQDLTVAQSLASSLTSTRALAGYRLQTEQALEAALTRQLAAIRAAVYSTSVTATQALLLFKLTRRNNVVAMKSAKLANAACATRPTSSNPFLLNRTGEALLFTPRQLDIGLTNRVIAGMLLHQTRADHSVCPESRFEGLESSCDGAFMVAPYGVDPVFKESTTLYNPILNDVDQVIVLEYHNCVGVDNPTYNRTVGAMTCNVEPYCFEQYNCGKVPFAFDAFPLLNKDPGFPVWFDINLGSQGSDKFFTYTKEGLFIDRQTEQITAELVIYNPQLRIFGYYLVKFSFNDGGSIKVKTQIKTIRVELYNSNNDDVRFGLEIMLNLFVLILFLSMLHNIYLYHKEGKKWYTWMTWFSHGWNLIEFISNGLLVATCVLWWNFVNDYAKQFRISLRYDVYKSLTPTANYFELEDDGVHLTEAWNAIHELKEVIEYLNMYFAISGFNVLLVIARILKRMDFQPRLGVVTRSMWHAGPDLLHFAVVASMVFIAYAMMAHVIFGNAVSKFATLGDSITYCFEMLLGNIDVHKELQDLGGVLAFSGELFFWTYELFVYLVLLNFLLAIIVDAFAKVKEETQETTGVHTELFHLLSDKWRGFMGHFSSNYIADEKLGSLLKQWAGVEGHVEKKGDKMGPKVVTLVGKEFKANDLKSLMVARQQETTILSDEEADQLEDRTSAVKRKAKEQAVHLADSIFPGKGLLGKKKPPSAISMPQMSTAASKLMDVLGEETIIQVVKEEEEQETQEMRVQKEHDHLAQALERLAMVQKELAESQDNLLNAQSKLSGQQDKLLGLVTDDRSAGQAPWPSDG